MISDRGNQDAKMQRSLGQGQYFERIAVSENTMGEMPSIFCTVDSILPFDSRRGKRSCIRKAAAVYMRLVRISSDYG